MSIDSSTRTAVVVGAGPVGCLVALSLANMGWNVCVYEGRSDIRLASQASSSLRSINLAISARGIAALQAINSAAASRLLETVIPMKGRMIHDVHGNQQSQLYDQYGKCINSVDRGLLNVGLLEDVLVAPRVRVFFEHKLATADFDKRELTFRNARLGKDVNVEFDLCVGADGSYSNVRRQLMRVVRMDFQQTYIPHEYIELKMPAGRDADGIATFLLDPNHLHIWPRHSFMFIALPNQDKSFTCTLFAPTTDFAQLDSPSKALKWFEKHFPDALSLIGTDRLIADFMSNPRSPLISIKAKPYHYKDRVIILGDAAHSMVPFYGQGLNCGLEDVRVLDIILRNEGVDPAGSIHGTDVRLERALQCYSDTRHEDLVAICDLAMDNYVEMRHSVATPTYLFRRALDHLFSQFTPRSQESASSTTCLPQQPFPSSSPGGWIPLYTMVTFRPDINYAAAKRKAKRQSQIVEGLGWTGAIGLGALGLGLIGMKLLPLVKKGP